MSAHALLIGISQFEDPKLAKLNAPIRDVEAFAQVLQDPSRGGFDSVESSIDEDFVTIRDRLSTLLDRRSPEDLTLLYYSGHGIVGKGQRLYLATGQSSFDRPQTRSLAASEIRDMLEQSRAGRAVVILDCCHSGVFAQGTKGASAAPLTDSTFDSGDGAEGQYVLTATNALQYAYDASGVLQEGIAVPALSRFTEWLVDGLGKGEAAPDNDRITFDALYQYICKRARMDGADTTPHRFVKGGSGQLVLARNPLAVPDTIPSDLLARLNSPEWSTRREAVAGLGILAARPRMAPLVENAILDRVSTERDRVVYDAMRLLLRQLGSAPTEYRPPSGENPNPAKQQAPDQPRVFVAATEDKSPKTTKTAGAAEPRRPISAPTEVNPIRATPATGHTHSPAPTLTETRPPMGSLADFVNRAGTRGLIPGILALAALSALPGAAYVYSFLISGPPPTDTPVADTSVAESLIEPLAAEQAPSVDPLDSLLSGAVKGDRNLQRQIAPTPGQVADLSPAANAKFLADNAMKPEFRVLPSGLQYRVLKSGTGKSPEGFDEVIVTYKGSLINGRVFDQTPPGQTETITGFFVPGLDEALPLMKEGDEWELVVPANLGFGAASGAIKGVPPNQTLVYQIALLEVRRLLSGDKRQKY